MSRKLWFIDLAWLLFCGLLASVWCWTAARQLGATFDEPVYLIQGLHRWHTGSPDGLMRLGTMPLPVDVVTLPLVLLEKWRGETIDPVREWEQVIPWARAATLVFFWLLLVHGFLYARFLGGPWAGRLVVPLIAWEPSLLAHSALATTDVAITACLLALVYYFHRGRDAGWWRRVALPALWFGLALTAKASALVYAPVCLLVVGIGHLLQRADMPAASWLTKLTVGPTKLWRHVFNVPKTSNTDEIGTLKTCRHNLMQPTLRTLWSQLGPLRRDLTTIFLGGLAFCFVYVGSDWKPQPDFVTWANSLPEGGWRSSMVWLSQHLCLFNNAGAGLARQISHNVRGHGSYLMGYYHPRALWFYFPVLLLIKLTLATLLPLALVLLFRPRALVNTAFLAAAALFLLTPTFRVQLGIRMILPLVTLALVGLAVALVSLLRDAPPRRRLLLASVVTASVLWGLVSVVAIWPNGICYVNELWGGQSQAYHLVSEANYDWGQGLPELERWQKEHGIKQMRICYFGSDPILHRLPVTPIPLYQPKFQDADALPAALAGNYLAISTSLLDYAVDTPGMLQSIAYLKRCRPVGRTTTFLIYDFTR